MGQNRYLVTETVQQVLEGKSPESAQGTVRTNLRAIGLRVGTDLEGAWPSRVQLIAEEIGDGTIAYERGDETPDRSKQPLREFGALETKHLGIGGIHAVPRWAAIAGSWSCRRGTGDPGRCSFTAIPRRRRRRSPMP